MYGVSGSELERARRAVAPIAAQLSEPLARYRPLAWRQALEGLPVLNLDDVSAIPFLVDIEGVEEYQHRARLRAGDGDLFAAVTPQDETYEAYNRARLGLGEAELVLAEGTGNLLAVAEAASRGPAFERVAARARDAGGLVVHPYMGIETVWQLARRVAEAAAVPVGVLGPPPPVTWAANDKGTFSDIVARVVGSDFLVETSPSADVSTLASSLLDLARRHRRVALKRLRCASAMGNAVFESATLAGLGVPEVERQIRLFLERTEWDGREQVLAVAWEETDISPSTQLWIPPAGEGNPRLDGIYEQILKGTRRVFVGSRPAGLPERVQSTLASSSLRVGAALQELGYVGRCSFDFLLVGDPHADFAVRFVECNGRWGGTSTPMALLDRLLERRHGEPRPPYRAQDFVHPGLVGAAFDRILEAVGGQAFERATGRGRFVFYNVGPLEHFGKLDVIAVGRTQDEAEAALEADLPRLLGLS